MDDLFRILMIRTFIKQNGKQNIAHFETTEIIKPASVHSNLCAAVRFINEGNISIFINDVRLLPGQDIVFAYPIENITIDQTFFVRKEIKKIDPVVPTLRYLTLQKNGPYGSVMGSGHYAAGENVIIDAQPDGGYMFEKWADELGQPISTENPYSFIMPDHNLEITAFFKEDIQEAASYNVSSSVIMGGDTSNVLGGGLYAVGTPVALEAKPGEGYTFSKWTQENDDVAISINTIYEFMMPEKDVVLWAWFNTVEQ